MTDWTYRPGHAEVDVSIHDAVLPADLFHRSIGQPLAVVSFNGDENLMPYAAAAYFDKIFSNLRNDRHGAEDLIDRVVHFVGGIEEQTWDTLFAGLADFERLSIPGGQGSALRAAAIRPEADSEGFAGVRAKLVATSSALGATTHFRPKLRGENPTVAELGFWALWDWTTLALLERQEFDELARFLNRFTYQLRHYRAHGLPGFRQMGVAPLLAATEVTTA